MDKQVETSKLNLKHVHILFTNRGLNFKEIKSYFLNLSMSEVCDKLSYASNEVQLLCNRLSRCYVFC